MKKSISILMSLFLVACFSISSTTTAHADDGWDDVDKEKIGKAFAWGAAQGSIGTAIGTMIMPGTGTVGGAALGAVIGGTVAAVGEVAREVLSPSSTGDDNGDRDR